MSYELDAADGLARALAGVRAHRDRLLATLELRGRELRLTTRRAEAAEARVRELSAEPANQEFEDE